MGKREDIEAQIKALQDEAAAIDDGDYDVWVKDDKGREVKLSGKHGKTVLQQLGVVAADEPADGGDGNGGDGDGGDGGKDDPPQRKGYFR